MADQDSPLRSLLQRAGLSPEQLARRLNRQAEQLGLPNRVDEKTPYKWLRGTRPRDPWPTLITSTLSDVLRCTIEAKDLGWPTNDQGVFSVPADSGLILPWTATGALAAASEVTETRAMDGRGRDRRIFLNILGSALTEPAFEWLIARPASDVARSGSRRVQAEHVEALEDITARLRTMDDQLGGGAVLDLVRAQTRHVLNLLRNHSYNTSIGARLHGSAAELLRLGGWLHFDAGQHAEAQRYWLAALHAAHAAGDRAIGANILGFMSCQAKDLSLYSEAIKLSEAARQGYPGQSPRVGAILNMRAAQAYARSGEVRDCQAAMDVAYELLHASPPESGDPAWAYWLDEPQINEQIGYCHLRLENWGKARSHLRLAVRLQSLSAPREGALRQALLALTYARQGEPEQSCGIAMKAVETLARDVDSDRCIGHIRKVKDALSGYRRLSAVMEFNTRIRQELGIST